MDPHTFEPTVLFENSDDALREPDAHEKMFQQALDGIVLLREVLKDIGDGECELVDTVPGNLPAFLIHVCVKQIEMACKAQRKAVSMIDTLPEEDWRVAAAGITNGTTRAINMAVDVTATALAADAARSEYDGAPIDAHREAADALSGLINNLTLRGTDDPKPTHATTAERQ